MTPITDIAIALPDGWQDIDLLAGDAADVLGTPLAGALAEAAAGSPQARLLMLRSLVAQTPSGEPLSAGLSIAIADAAAPVSQEPLRPESFAEREVAVTRLPVGTGLRIRHVAPARVLAGRPPLEMLRVQYLLDTAHGLLTITFTTAQAPHAPEWETLFDAMVATCEIT
jgi:hypothetical protein